MSVQAPRDVVMIRPNRFRPNEETRKDNSFQSTPEMSANDVADAALAEFDRAVKTLTQEGCHVHVFQDTRDDTPDSVFPNNWFSTHPGGHVAIYPMYAPSRRRERRSDVIEMLKSTYRVQEVTDYTGLEPDGLYLEGTGAMALDHVGRLAFVARSHRADPILLERFCARFGYEPIVFDAVDARGTPVYHTNVLMAVGTHIALVGLDMIPDAERRQTIVDRLSETGREVVALSAAQIASFAGNAIELDSPGGPLLALSVRALEALGPDQLACIMRHTSPIALSIPTIESAGGSVRCMIAGIHLARRALSQESST